VVAVSLAVETLLLVGRPSRALSSVRALADPGVREGRVRMLEARALADTGDMVGARSLLDAGMDVNDLREGEDGLHGLWSSVHPDASVPARYDFRMGTGDGELQR